MQPLLSMRWRFCICTGWFKSLWTASDQVFSVVRVSALARLRFWYPAEGKGSRGHALDSYLWPYRLSTATKFGGWRPTVPVVNGRGPSPNVSGLVRPYTVYCDQTLLGDQTRRGNVLMASSMSQPQGLGPSVPSFGVHIHPTVCARERPSFV